MKITAHNTIFKILQVICFVVAPIFFIWMQYSSEVQSEAATQFKVEATALIVIAAVVLLAKNILLKGFLQKNSVKIANYETQGKALTDQVAIKSTKKAYIWCKIVEVIASMALPLIVFILAILTCRALEDDIIKLYGVLCIVGVMFAMGFIFRFIDVLTCKMEHEV